ncbi:MAG TPA: hypothetical protein VFC25_13175 [Verrucomicrobiae bacterium]|nr:hypothetical protein [Verrucomicrobiae bacterium]
MPRRLTWFDRYVKAPLGMLYLVFLLLLAVPVLLWMSLLYWTVQGVRSFRSRGGGSGPREITNRAA